MFWIWLLAIFGPIIFTVLTFAAFLIGKFSKKPLASYSWDGADVDLIVSERKLPVTAHGIVAPVGPDLKMLVGVAKWIRDASANTIQQAADLVAPLEVGDAWVGPGGRYRFGKSVLAVVKDDSNRVSADTITAAFTKALELAALDGLTSIVVPDPTDDLLRQPNWITAEQRRATCAPIAQAVVHAVRKSAHQFDSITIWVWKSGNEDLYQEALEAMEPHYVSHAQAAASHA